MEVSVIMPVYNSIKYLGLAIRSVLNQTFSDFELILVDDGSTDGSSKICDKYALVDSRIKVIHKANAGISDSRNKGLGIAIGKYITFIDNDDEYKDTLLEDNVKLIKEYNVDFIKYNFKKIWTDGQVNIIDKTTVELEFNVITKESLVKKYKNIREKRLLDEIWNGIYRKSFFLENNIKFDTTMKFGSEDTCINFLLYQKANCIIINPKIYYIHYIRQNHSTSTKFNINRIYSIVKTAQVENKFFKDNKIDNNYWESLISRTYIVAIVYNVLRKESDLNMKEKKEVLKKFRKNPLDFSKFTLESFKILWNKSKLKAIVILLYYLKLYNTLCIASKIFNR